MNSGASGTLGGEWQPASDEVSDFGCRGAGSAQRGPRRRGSLQRLPRICTGLPSAPVLMSSDRTGAGSTVSPPLVPGRAGGRDPASVPDLHRTAKPLSRCWLPPCAHPVERNATKPASVPALTNRKFLSAQLARDPVLRAPVRRSRSPPPVRTGQRKKQLESHCRFGDDQRCMHPSGGLTVADLDVRTQIAIS